jgi:preprotein translocase subunit SecY
MWLGEQITEKGIGNGISMIIFAGIVSGLPSAVGSTFVRLKHCQNDSTQTRVLCNLALTTLTFFLKLFKLWYY